MIPWVILVQLGGVSEPEGRAPHHHLHPRLWSWPLQLVLLLGLEAPCGPGLRTEGGAGPAARDSSPQATPQRLSGHQVPLSGSAVRRREAQAWHPTRFQNNGLPRLVWHPSKTTSKLPVVKHHINIVSLQILEITGLTQRAQQGHVWSRGARRRGLGGMSPGWEHPPACRQIPQQPLGNRDSGSGDRGLFFTAGRKCLQPKLDRPGSP